MHVGVVFGGRSVEHQVSIASARTVARGLREAGHRVTPLGIAQDGCWLDRGAAAAVLAGDQRAIPPLGAPVAPTLDALLTSGVEVIFPIVHGSWGEDGTLQGLCEMLDLPYVGPGVTTSAVAMDKLYTKRLLAAAGVPDRKSVV
jgi:D-alanine-D-alanine ligase